MGQYNLAVLLYLTARIINYFSTCEKLFLGDQIAPASGGAFREQIHDILYTLDGCVVKLIMKDKHTIGNRPENIVGWTKIAKEGVVRFMDR
jgi:hypothetical protein